MQRSQLPFWKQIRWKLIIYSILLATFPIIMVTFMTLPRRSAQDAKDAFKNKVAECRRDDPF